MANDLNSVWYGIHQNLADYDFDEDEITMIKNAIFCELGRYTFEKKIESTEIVEYNSENKGYTMFFVAKAVEGLSHESLLYYKGIINKFLSLFNKPLDTFCSDDIRWYLAQRQLKDKVSTTTANNERRVLSSFFGWLADEQYIKSNICRPIKNIKTKKTKKKAFTDVEILKIKDACTDIDVVQYCPCGEKEINLIKKRNLALIEFLLSTACRVGEISGLKRENIDLENRTAVVCGKGNKERTVFLTPTAKTRLMEYWEIDGKKEYVFSDWRKNEPIAKSTIERITHAIGERAGVKNCHPHRFRRTCATMAIKKGMSAMDVQRMLGHVSMETTRIYLDLDDSDLKYQHDKFF